MATGWVPARAERASTCRPPMCQAGIASSQVPGPPTRACRASADQLMPSRVSATPLGAPLDPDVVTTTATSSYSSGAAGSSARSCARTPALAAGPPGCPDASTLPHSVGGRGSRAGTGAVQRGGERGEQRVDHRRVPGGGYGRQVSGHGRLSLGASGPRSPAEVTESAAPARLERVRFGHFCHRPARTHGGDGVGAGR